MDISLTIVGAIMHLIILCVRCFCSRSWEQKKSNRIPAKKAQDARWAVVSKRLWPSSQRHIQERPCTAYNTRGTPSIWGGTSHPNWRLDYHGYTYHQQMLTRLVLLGPLQGCSGSQNAFLKAHSCLGHFQLRCNSSYLFLCEEVGRVNT